MFAGSLRHASRICFTSEYTDVLTIVKLIMIIVRVNDIIQKVLVHFQYYMRMPTSVIILLMLWKIVKRLCLYDHVCFDKKLKYIYVSRGADKLSGKNLEFYCIFGYISSFVQNKFLSVSWVGFFSFLRLDFNLIDCLVLFVNLIPITKWVYLQSDNYIPYWYGNWNSGLFEIHRIFQFFLNMYWIHFCKIWKKSIASPPPLPRPIQISFILFGFFYRKYSYFCYPKYQ